MLPSWLLPKGLFTAHELKGNELACSKSASRSMQSRDAFTGHARQRHDLISCSETRTVVLSQFVRCEHSRWEACSDSS